MTRAQLQNNLLILHFIITSPVANTGNIDGTMVENPYFQFDNGVAYPCLLACVFVLRYMID